MRLLFDVKQGGNDCILCDNDVENFWKINVKLIKVLSQLFRS